MKICDSKNFYIKQFDTNVPFKKIEQDKNLIRINLNPKWVCVDRKNELISYHGAQEKKEKWHPAENDKGPLIAKKLDTDGAEGRPYQNLLDIQISIKII